jgi:hypothetical protein
LPGAPSLRVIAALALGVAILLSASAATPSAGRSVVGRVTVSPLLLTLRLSSNEAPAGRRIRATATLHNLGAATLRSASLELRTDPSGLLTIGPKRRAISQLKPGKSRAVQWRLCGIVPASYVVVAVALARTDTGTVYEAESEGELLAIQAREHPPSCDEDDEDDEDD